LQANVMVESVDAAQKAAEGLKYLSGTCGKIGLV
jgi:hypothetical protein